MPRALALALTLGLAAGCNARGPGPGPADAAVAAPADAAGATPADGAVAAPADGGPADAAASPPPPPGWVDVAAAIPDAVLDLRYASARNLTGAPLYPRARCLLRAPVAARLAAAAAALRRAGHRLLLWDCYRPASVQRELWRRVPDPDYVAEPTFDDAGRPTGGSRHSRGAAVDLSLADADGAPRLMPTDHDAFGPAASGAGATGVAARHHAALRRAMSAAGFAPLPTEWWHYDAVDWAAHALADEPL